MGKTTTTVSLAEAFAAEGRRVLVVDLGTQANASLLVFGNEGDEHLFQAISDYATISDWLLENFEANEQKRLEEYIVTDASDVTANGKPLPLDLIPSSPRLRKTEKELIYHLTEQGYSMEALENQVGRRLRDDFNLNDPLFIQSFKYLGDLAQFDFGTDFDDSLFVQEAQFRL